MVAVNYQYADNFSVIIITDSTVIFTTFDDFQQMTGKSHSKYPQKISKLGRLSNSNYWTVTKIVEKITELYWFY